MAANSKKKKNMIIPRCSNIHVGNQKENNLGCPACCQAGNFAVSGPVLLRRGQIGH